MTVTDNAPSDQLVGGQVQVTPTPSAPPLGPPPVEPGPIPPMNAVARMRTAAAHMTGWGTIVRLAAITLAVIILAFLLFLTVISGLLHQNSQTRNYTTFRNQLAEGVVPTSGITTSGHLLASGTPIALLQIPSIGMHEVVCEGTSSGVLSTCPGHLRSTVFPGQAGYSVVMGRRAAYGGPFKHISTLDKGAVIQVTSGQGRAMYKVVDVRMAGDISPPPPATGSGRLILETATGAPFDASGVLYVDANLVTRAQPGDGASLASASVPAAERPLGTDSSSLWVLVLWLQALLLTAVLAVRLYLRWGPAQTWITMVPFTMLIGIFICSQLVKLLPNMT